MENKIPFHVKMESMSNGSIGNNGSSVENIGVSVGVPGGSIGSPISGGSNSNGSNSSNGSPSSPTIPNNLNKHIANLRDLNLNNGNNNHPHPHPHHKFLTPSNVPPLNLNYPSGSPSPSLEPTDLSCKSPRSISRNSNNYYNTGAGGLPMNLNGKRFNEIDTESISDEIDSDGGTSSGSSNKKTKTHPLGSSRSPSPSSAASEAPSPVSEEDNGSPINLVQSSRNRDFSRERNSDSSSNTRDTNNNTNTNGLTNGSRKAKPKPPPITGIPTSPTRLGATYASSLQTPLVTFQSPFFNSKNTTPAGLLPTAAAFSFWNSISPLILSPRYGPGSPAATPTSSSNHFQFPVGHHLTSNHSSPPGHSSLNLLPSSLNPLTPYSLSPLLSGSPFSPFDAQMLFSPSPTSKSISVLQ